MQAIFENGGINKGFKLTLENFNALNMILNAISESDSSEELLTNLESIRHKFRRATIKFEFSFGATSDGISIYFLGQDKRLILVPCETDVEI